RPFIHLDVAFDGVVSIERAENAFHDNLGALLGCEEPIAGLQFADQDLCHPVGAVAVIVQLVQHLLGLHIAAERHPRISLRWPPWRTKHWVGNRTSMNPSVGRVGRGLGGARGVLRWASVL